MKPNSIWKRPIDLFIVAFFVIAVWYGIFFSLPQALRLAPITPDSSYPLFALLLYPYAKAVEPLLLHPTITLDLRHTIDGFVTAPLLCVIGFGIIRAKDWVRIPSLIYAVLAIVNMAYHITESYFGAHRVGNDVTYWSFNAFFVGVPLLLAWRMRHPNPFGKVYESS